MRFLIEANVTIRVEGISGPWDKKIGYIVNAPNIQAAKMKFETQVRNEFANMMAKSFVFTYTMLYPEI